MSHVFDDILSVIIWWWHISCLCHWVIDLDCHKVCTSFNLVGGIQLSSVIPLVSFIKYDTIPSTLLATKRGTFFMWNHTLTGKNHNHAWKTLSRQINSLTAIGPYIAHRFSWALLKLNNFSIFCLFATLGSSKCSQRLQLD